jgi:hypothetical protein
MSVEITYNGIDLTEPIGFAVHHMQMELKNSGIAETFRLVLHKDETIGPQGYRRVLEGTEVHITATEDAGFLYGILDLARDICQENGFRNIGSALVTPYLLNRGIKLNIPLDARTPSYSDASDSAFHNIEHMWEYDFWTEFLDRMALNRYNVLSLWTLSPFPSLVRIPEYPLTALEDVKRSLRPPKADLSGWGMYSEDMEKSLVTVKKLKMDEKISFWQSVMEYAANRCIKIFLFTWNLFVYGTEHNPYGISCDQNNPVTKDYIYCGTKALMDTYPLLAGIGVTSGEHMLRDDSDIPFLADSYGRGVRDYLAEHPEREFRFIHRMQYTRYDSIIEEFRDFPCPFGISFKYSQAHMYSSTKPSFIDTFLKEKSKDIRIWLTVRNDDFYMYRWGDPEFARDYLKQMPRDTLEGYYMGADGYTWGRDYMDLRDTSHPLFFDKMWYMFFIWGQLSYNIELPMEGFRKELNRHFPIKDMGLYEGLRHSSAILQEFNQVHWHDYDFQWYPEGCCWYDFETDKLNFADVNEFMECSSMPEGEYYSVPEYCEAVVRGDKLIKITPLQAADSIRQHAELAKKELDSIRGNAEFAMKELNSLCRKEGNNPELLYTLDDMEALSLLGYYYADKLEAAVLLKLGRMTGNVSKKSEAVVKLTQAAAYWKQYSVKSTGMYRPQLLTRLCGIVDVQRFNRLAELDILSASE